MDKYFNIIQNRLDKLIQISIKERQEHGMGALFLDFTKTDNMDCKYIALHWEQFPANLREHHSERMATVPTSIIFFYLYDNENSAMLEVDLDKNSQFHDTISK